MKHILLLEPDRILAQSYKTVLEADGLSAVHESSAAMALEVMNKQAPAAIIMELQLAGNNGVEFLYELRSYPDWQTIPVLIHTLVPYDESMLSTEMMIQLKIFDYCYKPHTNLRDLIRLTKGMLS